MSILLRHRIPLIIVLLSAFSLALYADTDAVARKQDGTRIYGDSALYQGMSLKVDLGNTLLELGLSKAKIQSYEIAMNWRLKRRFFPTLELGYARGERSTGGVNYNGQGGFARVGLDFNGLKKHPDNPNALLVGLRIGTSVQQYDLTGVTLNSTYWGEKKADYLKQLGTDCWGEVVAGCQVQVWEGLQMGWYLRFKILFTRTAKDNHVLPYYLPGYGYRQDTNWGINYYIGYWF